MRKALWRRRGRGCVWGSVITALALAVSRNRVAPHRNQIHQPDGHYDMLCKITHFSFSLSGSNELSAKWSTPSSHENRPASLLHPSQTRTVVLLIEPRRVCRLDPSTIPAAMLAVSDWNFPSSGVLVQRVYSSRSPRGNPSTGGPFLALL
jgi:hypothetical protein